jgi:hypothetical protein
VREFSASAVPISYKGLQTQRAFTSVLKHNINHFSTNTRFCPNRFAPQNPTNKKPLALLFCTIFGLFFNIMGAFFAHQSPTRRKKSILARVCFDAKRG